MSGPALHRERALPPQERLMKSSSVFVNSVIRHRISCVALAVFATTAVAQEEVSEVPANATAMSYGSGWHCDRGYREIEGACAAILVPPNAFATNYSFGSGWMCSHGYRQVEEACMAVDVPLNGYLDESGDGWRCGRGYREMEDGCAAILVPQNGYLTDSSYGVGWECDRGYRAVGDACVAIEIQENAHLRNSGSCWECSRP